MKARPILFSAPMIRALLAGRKTQTRRIVKPGPPDNLFMYEHLHGWRFEGVEYDGDDVETCPHGAPGDLLWSRETWSQPTSLDPGPVFYRADYPACVAEHFENVPSEDLIKWRPSIFQPRSASRFTLAIADVRVERLQDISEEDAVAEGWPGPDEQNSIASAYPIAWYSQLWESINGVGSWEANPWLWALTLTVEKRNVDQVLRAAA